MILADGSPWVSYHDDWVRYVNDRWQISCSRIRMNDPLPDRLWIAPRVRSSTRVREAWR